ncbi:MAG: DUF3053 family protein, partial [Hyphomicrobiales bacterium]|nr:DUF3053 family protein [Hyphomicrobiales bacterium]
MEFLQTRILDKPGVHVPKPSEEETKSFGDYEALWGHPRFQRRDGQENLPAHATGLPKRHDPRPGRVDNAPLAATNAGSARPVEPCRPNLVPASPQPSRNALYRTLIRHNHSRDRNR